MNDAFAVYEPYELVINESNRTENCVYLNNSAMPDRGKSKVMLLIGRGRYGYRDALVYLCDACGNELSIMYVSCCSVGQYPKMERIYSDNDRSALEVITKEAKALWIKLVKECMITNTQDEVDLARTIIIYVKYISKDRRKPRLEMLIDLTAIREDSPASEIALNETLNFLHANRVHYYYKHVH